MQRSKFALFDGDWVRAAAQLARVGIKYVIGKEKLHAR